MILIQNRPCSVLIQLFALFQIILNCFREFVLERHNPGQLFHPQVTDAENNCTITSSLAGRHVQQCIYRLVQAPSIMSHGSLDKGYLNFYCQNLANTDQISNFMRILHLKKNNSDLWLGRNLQKHNCPELQNQKGKGEE